MKNKKLIDRMREADWICQECGEKYIGVMQLFSTWHQGECDVCKKVDYVTEPRDFAKKITHPQRTFWPMVTGYDRKTGDLIVENMYEKLTKKNGHNKQSDR